MSSKTLCTFSGPNGDILWSLATTKAISKMVGEPVDFCCMQYYETLLPLLRRQSYIANAFIDKNWIRVSSNHGDQPSQPPKELERGYEKCFHLTYKGHPGLGAESLSLIQFIAKQQGIALQDPIPFIECDDLVEGKADNTIAVGFNYQYQDLKDKFLEHLKTRMPEFDYLDVTKMPWTEAASWIKNSLCFVGCRSSNNVIAHGVGQQNIFIYEPHPSRHNDGMLGFIFSCPFDHAERTAAHSRTPAATAEVAASYIENWKKLTTKEVTNV